MNCAFKAAIYTTARFFPVPVEEKLRVQTEVLPELFCGPLRVPDVSFPRGIMLWRKFIVQHFSENRKQLQNAHLIAAGHVEYFAHCFRFLAGDQIGSHTICHISEITRLTAVTVDDTRFLPKHVLYKNWNNGRILQFRILARSP